MSEHGRSSAAGRPADAEDHIDEAALERALREVPRGTVAVAGLSVALLVLGYLLIYFAVFIPRGPVG